MQTQSNFEVPPCANKKQAEYSLERLITDPYTTRTAINAINQDCAKIAQTLAETVKKVY